MFGKKKVRYAVVGAGWFAQAAILPAFANSKSGKLVAIVSGDATKHEELGDRYGVPCYTYEEYDGLLASGAIDAVFIALPNAMHKEYTLRAARHQIHILCEKPLAADAGECLAMIDACHRAGVKLMTAYRLHFDPANLDAIALIESGKIGEPRLFHGINCQAVEDGNTRLDGDLKGGPLMDLGVYCINAARYLFRDEPLEVSGFTASPPGEKFDEVPDMVTAMLRFPKDRLAVFSCGFGEAKVSELRVVGTTGDIRLDPAYSFQADVDSHWTNDRGETETKSYRERDQVGAEIEYFSDCILDDHEPEPNGVEGWIDLTLIDAIKRSIRSGRAETVGPFDPKPRPTPDMAFKLPKIKPPKLIHSESPTGK